MCREARGAQAAGPVGINHGFLLIGSVAQAADPIGLQNGFIHRCHGFANYNAYEIRRPESSGGAIDPAYIQGKVSSRFPFEIQKFSNAKNTHSSHRNPNYLLT
jgi:hypothetical protein